MKNLTHIFGCPRSGTTWLWSLLQSHPDITPFTLYPPKDGIYKTSESGYIIHNNVDKLIDFCKKHKYVIEKTPLHTLHYNKIIKLFPESRNILLVRHPISIYTSYLKSDVKSLPSNRTEIVNHIKNYYSYYKNIKEQSLTIAYELLNDDTQGTLNKIFDYINMNGCEYKDFNTQNIVALPWVYRKGKNFSFQEELSEGEIVELQKNFKNEIEFWKTIYFFQNYVEV